MVEQLRLIQMTDNGVAMECHKDDILKLSRDKLEVCIGFQLNNGLAIGQHFIFVHYI